MKAVLFLISLVASQEVRYVFEINRHGARAPYIYDHRFKTEPTQELTPMGMRQRYLLGKYNQLKYGHLLSDLDVTSTAKQRTLQSGYSEL